MTNRILRLQGDPGSNATNFELGSAQPQSGKQFVTQGFYVDGNSDIDYSIEINETTHIDAVDGDNLPGPADPLPFEVTLTDSDSITALADETAGGTQNGTAVYVLVTDTGKEGGNAR